MRAWIETLSVDMNGIVVTSPAHMRAWIETRYLVRAHEPDRGRPLICGRGLKHQFLNAIIIDRRRPLICGRGLKLALVRGGLLNTLSPAHMRAWIET